MRLFQKNFVFDRSQLLHGIMKHSSFLNNCLLSNHYLITQKLTKFTVSVVEILYENIPLTEMLSILKEAKKHVYVYCFYGKHFTCWDWHGMLETDNFG